MIIPQGEPFYDGQLFRLHLQEVEGRERPFEFIRRIGAATVLPVSEDEHGDPIVLTITNQRQYYGLSEGLPGGNADGGFTTPEPPHRTAQRETIEEIGYDAPDGIQDYELFRLRDVSSTIDYPRYFAFARGLRRVGGELNNPNEIVTVNPVPLSEYMVPLLELERGEVYPEVVLALRKAADAIGRRRVTDWIAGVSREEYVNEIVVSSFEPWMTPVYLGPESNGSASAASGRLGISEN